MVFARLRGLVQSVGTILAIVQRMEARQIAMATQGTHMSKNIDDAISAVRAETDIMKSAATALGALQSQLSDAQGQIVALQSAVAAGTADPAKVQELLDLVATSSAQLSAAIPVNVTLATGTATAPAAVVVAPVGGSVVSTALASDTPVVADAPGTVAAPTVADSTSAGALSGAAVVAPVVLPGV